MLDYNTANSVLLDYNIRCFGNILFYNGNSTIFGAFYDDTLNGLNAKKLSGCPNPNPNIPVPEFIDLLRHGHKRDRKPLPLAVKFFIHNNEQSTINDLKTENKLGRILGCNKVGPSLFLFIETVTIKKKKYSVFVMERYEMSLYDYFINGHDRGYAKFKQDKVQELAKFSKVIFKLFEKLFEYTKSICIDLKLENFLINTNPFDVRMIDFDGRFCRIPDVKAQIWLNKHIKPCTNTALKDVAPYIMALQMQLIEESFNVTLFPGLETGIFSVDKERGMYLYDIASKFIKEDMEIIHNEDGSLTENIRYYQDMRYKRTPVTKLLQQARGSRSECVPNKDCTQCTVPPPVTPRSVVVPTNRSVVVPNQSVVVPDRISVRIAERVKRAASKRRSLSPPKRKLAPKKKKQTPKVHKAKKSPKRNTKKAQQKRNTKKKSPKRKTKTPLKKRKTAAKKNTPKKRITCRYY